MTASHHYKAFSIRKRSGGYRTIHHPSRELKAIHRWLLLKFISKFEVHLAAAAYRPKRNILWNAAQHASKQFLLRMDFTDFFPSITADDVAFYLRANGRAGITDATDIDWFCRVVCFNGRLTIGAPTSPALSNAVCRSLDEQIDACVRGRGVVFTRYADDLFFSCDEPNVLSDVEKQVKLIIDSLAVPKGLKLNAMKTRHLSRKVRRHVTGITLGSDGRTHLGRYRKREIRSLVYEYESLPVEAKCRLQGLLAFARDIEPDFVNALILKYGPERVAAAMGGALSM